MRSNGTLAASPAPISSLAAVTSFGILSTFPPTACGIATFSAALAGALTANGATVSIVRVGAASTDEHAPMAAARGGWDPGTAIDTLNAARVALVQHEYGIYPGVDGDAVLDVLRGLVVPAIVVAHTVVQDPTPHQREVLEQVCHEADRVVVMTAAARARLVDGYEVDGSKVLVIPHGAVTGPQGSQDQLCSRRGRGPRLLTWGLLGPGKGIEWAIDAVASFGDLHPRPHYLVAGATHPKVRASSGEAYREMLMARSLSSGADAWVSFDESYRDLTTLNELICSADVVILPYDSKDQVTSGVLVDAVAAGRPVVATAFPHAVELLASGAGLVVPQRDPTALARAIRSVLGRPDLAKRMAAEATRLAPELAWEAVAQRYDRLGAELLAGKGVVRT